MGFDTTKSIGCIFGRISGFVLGAIAVILFIVFIRFFGLIGIGIFLGGTILTAYLLKDKKINNYLKAILMIVGGVIALFIYIAVSSFL